MQTGYLKAFVFAADQIIPLRDASITVYRKGIIEGFRRTDKNGSSTLIPLNAPDMELSESPSSSQPFTTVDVVIEHVGYRPAVYRGVQIFAGETSIQNAEMIPLAENESNESEVYNTLPQDL